LLHFLLMGFESFHFIIISWLFHVHFITIWLLSCCPFLFFSYGYLFLIFSWILCYLIVISLSSYCYLSWLSYCYRVVILLLFYCSFIHINHYFIVVLFEALMVKCSASSVYCWVFSSMDEKWGSRRGLEGCQLSLEWAEALLLLHFLSFGLSDPRGCRDYVRFWGWLYSIFGVVSLRVLLQQNYTHKTDSIQIFLAIHYTRTLTLPVKIIMCRRFHYQDLSISGKVVFGFRI